MAHMIFIWLAAVLCGCAAYNGPDLPKGPFCGLTNQCCKNREDDCSHEILGTLCYCDEFCGRTTASDDCCPDYPAVCLGELPPPEPLILRECDYKGRKYYAGDTWMDDCNQCRCIPTSNTTAKYACDTEACLNDEDLARTVTDMRRGWMATTYSQFAGKTLREGLKYKLGTLPLRPETRHMVSVTYEPGELPPYFDARTKWPRYITPVQDQGWCGSDWAVSTATVLSDRFAIQSKGLLNELLSAQELLSCNTRGQQGCGGGHIDTAWQFSTKYGLVSETCMPYEARGKACPFPVSGNTSKVSCGGNRRMSRVYRSGPPSKLSTEKDIKYEIMNWGPVQAILTVYQDLFHYRSGVYRHTGFGESRLRGLHSVRVLGWGEEAGQPFWLVANTWGPEWGEAGFVRVARDDKATSLEFVVTTLADVADHVEKRKR